MMRARRREGPAAPALARRAQRLEVSPTVAMSARARSLKASGADVLDFTVGEPDQDTPALVVEAAKTALDAGRTRYAPPAGLPELRAAVCRRYREDSGLTVSPEEVVVTVGGKQGLALVYQAIVEAGSEVVVPIPAWPTFAEAARIAGGRAVLLPLRARDGFRLTARAVARVLSARTRAVVVNSPNNPTGAVVEPAEMAKIARLARERGFWLLLDDTYGQLTFEGQRPALQEMREASHGRLLVVGTASKGYCMTGWRIGWVIASPDLARACTALNSHSVQGPATFAQCAAVAALAGAQDGVVSLAAEYRKRRDAVHAALASLPGVSCPLPQGGFYVFPQVSRCLSRAMPDTIAFCARLLEEKGVATVPGEGFYAPGFFRLSCAAPLPDLLEGVRRIAAFVHQHAPGGPR